MKIKIEHPFTEEWDTGYLIHQKRQDRDYIMLRNLKTDKRKSILYSRYLACVKLGRILRSDEHVDHIDGNKHNDTLSNIQVLSAEEHRKKSAEENTQRAIEARKSRVPRHGTYWEYRKYGCRCELCTKAFHEYNSYQCSKYKRSVAQR